MGCGPINTLSQVFADPQVQARGHGGADASRRGARRRGGDRQPGAALETPAEYRLPPPLLGEHTESVLSERLGLNAAALAGLRERGVI